MSSFKFCPKTAGHCFNSKRDNAAGHENRREHFNIVWEKRLSATPGSTAPVSSNGGVPSETDNGAKLSTTPGSTASSVFSNGGVPSKTDDATTLPHFPEMSRDGGKTSSCATMLTTPSEHLAQGTRNAGGLREPQRHPRHAEEHRRRQRLEAARAVAACVHWGLEGHRPLPPTSTRQSRR